ncbi:MAG: hypothetical protein K2G52_04940 [Muribaculaceae bacterium]|nr:hypothetical protein [Muribaculaceae bacterium]
MKTSLTIMLLFLSFLWQGCIHTYPDAGAEDPTEVEIGVELSLSLKWDRLLSYYPGVRGGMSSKRIVVEISDNGALVSRHEQSVSQEDFEKGFLNFVVPTKLRTIVYTMAIWLDGDINNSDGSSAFDVSSLSSVSPFFNHGEYIFPEDCGFAVSTLDFREDRHKLSVRRIVRMELSPPAARFQFETTDVEDFLIYADDAIQRGEKYTVSLSYGGQFPTTFNALEGEPAGYERMVEVSSPLPALFSSQTVICSDWVFASKDRTELTVTLTIFNSAKMIVSKVRDITFPVERGKTTTIRGDFLTNFYSNNISVDNLWDDEIIVRIE